MNENFDENLRQINIQLQNLKKREEAKIELENQLKNLQDFYISLIKGVKLSLFN